MALLPALYSFASRSFRYDWAKNIKDTLRPFKQAIFGKYGMYAVADIVKELERKSGQDVEVVFDVGAAVGDTALTFLRSFPKAAVYCFEPLPASFARLRKRTAPFGARVSCFNHGLGAIDGMADLNISSYEDSSSFVPLEIANCSKERDFAWSNISGDSSPTRSGPFAQIISVPIKRLDDVVSELRIKRIDFLKIDVEGFEKELLEGGRKTLEITDNVYVEILPMRRGRHSHAHIDVFEILHEAGFSYAGVYGDFFFTKLPSIPRVSCKLRRNNDGIKNI